MEQISSKKRRSYLVVAIPCRELGGCQLNVLENTTDLSVIKVAIPCRELGGCQ